MNTKNHEASVASINREISDIYRDALVLAIELIQMQTALLQKRGGGGKKIETVSDLLKELVK